MVSSVETHLKRVRDRTKLKHTLLKLAEKYQEDISNVITRENKKSTTFKIQHLRNEKVSSPCDKQIIVQLMKSQKRSLPLNKKWDDRLKRKDDSQNELTREIILHYIATRPTKYTQKKRKIVLSFIRNVIELIYPEIKFTIFGSVASGLDDPNSDIDVGLLMNGMNLSLKESDELLMKIVETFQLLKDSGTIKVIPTLKAKVPIVTVEELLSGIQVDLSLRTADMKLKIFKEYIEVDDRVLPFLKILKHWSKQRDICNAYAGYINSFGFCCCGIAFMQNTNPPILPNLQISDKVIMPASQFENFGSSNKMTLGELFYAFFDKMAHFDYETTRISILRGGYAPKEKEQFEDQNISDHSFIIEDPFEPNVNFSRHVRKETLCVLKQEFQRAKSLLQEGSNVEKLCEKYYRAF